MAPSMMENLKNIESSGDEFPPGTVRIQDVYTSKTILVPHPTSDPNQPLNWTTTRKVVQMSLLCVYTTLIFSILTVMPPLWQDITAELGISTADLNYGYATAYASLTVACVFFIPLSINFGRRPVYLITAVIMLASAVWMGSIQTTTDVIASNFLSGISGSVNEALFQVTICDLFFVHQRGTMTGIYLLVVVLGTYLSPIAAGYVAASQGWRWVFWYILVFMGLTFVAMLFALEETKYELPSQPSESDFPPRMKSYRERMAFYTIGRKPHSYVKVLGAQLYQPFLVLVLFPAVMFSALQYAWSESMLSFLAVTQATLYPRPPYNFSSIGVGNMNIPPAIGAILGSIFGGSLSDYMVLAISKRRGGIYEPEYRLWTFMVPGVSMIVGVLMYGLTIAKGMPWIINSIGAGFVGFALGGCGDIALTYVQDSYDGIIGLALTAVVFVRNGIATLMTFVIPIWAANMGFWNMFVLLGVLTTLVVLTCIPLIVWGRYWRTKLADTYASLASQTD